MSGAPSLPSKKRTSRRNRARPEPLKPVVVGPCKETEGADVAEVVNSVRACEIDEMVNRFLMWPLPKSVCADLCATDKDYKFPRSGTNLLTADEARAMFEHVLKGFL